MNSGLADLESLVLKTRNEKVKSYIAEALLCYNVGAFRACIVYTWIATVFDLIEKVKELSINGDKRAQKLLDEFNLYRKQIEEGNTQGISSSLKFERELLQYANKDLELIDKMQLSDLERLKEDRHKCAHPAFIKDDFLFEPSAEQTRMHMRNSLVHLLINPPVQGKQALDSLLQLISSAYFPTTSELIEKEFKQSPLNNASKVLVKHFLETLFFDIFQGDKKYGRSFLVIINACYKIHPSISRESLLSCFNKHYPKVKDEDFHWLMYIIFNFNGKLWYDLTDPLKTRIKKFVSNDNPKIAKVAYSIIAISKMKELKPLIDSFVSNCTLETMKSIIEIDSNAYSIFKERIVNMYCDANYNWTKINNIAQLIMQYENYLNSSDIVKILSSLKDSGDKLSSHTLRELIKVLYKISKINEIDKIYIDTVLDEVELSTLKLDDETYNTLTENYPF